MKTFPNMRQLSTLAATLALLSQTPLAAAAADPAPSRRPCTIKSPTTGSFFDLNPISVKRESEDSHGKIGRSRNEGPPKSWHANGYDYGANFTLNFCAPVVEDLDQVVGLNSRYWNNVSAYYTMHGHTYSIGQVNDQPFLRGRKLVLNYTGGSTCDASQSPSDRKPYRSVPVAEHLSPLDAREIKPPTHKPPGRPGSGSDRDSKNPSKGPSRRPDDDDDDDEDHRKDNEDERPNKDKAARRKSTVISLLCDRDAVDPKATVAFVSASPDECTYFFEARSPAACGGKDQSASGLGPGGVFVVIALIAVLVYLIGGCVYQRTVMHQRGWRQLPNYAFWAGFVGFFKDMFVILFSSCLRFFPSRRGYSRLAANGSVRGRRSNSEDENRLIDQLDEEWDD